MVRRPLMTKEITITTTRGGKVKLVSDGYQIDAIVEIKGEQQTFSCVQIKNNSRFGDYLEFGPAVAPVSADTMKQIKSDKRLQNMALIKISRLSVQPVTEDEWKIILELSQKK